MVLHPTAFSNTNIKHLFATPLVVSDFSPEIIADLNPRLKALILDRERGSKGALVSNRGGWQSDDKILEWGGEPIATLLGCIRNLIGTITLYHDGTTYQRSERVEWRINGWANINRKGNSNVAHVHPGAYWAAVYYVAVDDSEESKGDIEFSDPRGCLPNMYCPSLRIGIQGYMTAGNSEQYKPKEGQCLIFPSWLYHAVTPYLGDTSRISVAFNFAV